jgi:hypothetical protein
MRLGIAGVQYRPPQDRQGWVCMVEAKYHSDIASHTTYGPCRNQMARVIEAAVTFQSGGPSGPVYPHAVHFALLTPHRFMDANRAGGGPRLYAYKFREYKRDPQASFDYIETASVSRRNGAGWQLPDLQQRLERLSLHWITYEHLIRAMPEGAYRQALIQFIQRQPGCLLDLNLITASAT